MGSIPSKIHIHKPKQMYGFNAAYTSVHLLLTVKSNWHNNCYRKLIWNIIHFVRALFFFYNDTDVVTALFHVAFLIWCRLHMQINSTISRCNLFLVHSTWACQVSPELFWTQNTHGTLCAQQRVASPRGSRTRLCRPWCWTPEEPGGGVFCWLRKRNMLQKWRKHQDRTTATLKAVSEISQRAGSPTRLNLSLTVTMLSPEKEQETERENAKGRGG